MIKKVLSIVLNLFLLICSSSCFIFMDFNNISRAVSIFLTLLPELLILLTIVFNWLHLKILKKLAYCSYVITCICLIGYSVLYYFDILSIFINVYTLKEYILSTREKGVIIYILIQLLQVVFLPIPASVICIVGSLIYGPLLGGIYCTIGVLLGSWGEPCQGSLCTWLSFLYSYIGMFSGALLAFFLGRKIGRPFVNWIVGDKETVDYYLKKLKGKETIILFFMFLLPMFPDDILCFIAGITKISTKKFFWVTLITRPIGVICMAYFGSGKIIPFNNWGIFVWLSILVLVIVFTIIMYKWQDKIQDFILTKVFQKKLKSKSRLNEN